MINENVRYGYNDVMIAPADISFIEHRSDCNPYTEEGMLPIFAAPMSTVIDTVNHYIFRRNRIIPIIPRNVMWQKRISFIYSGIWTAVSLKEFEEFVCDTNNFNLNSQPYHINILIDVANGNMNKIFALSKVAKKIHGKNITIMAGNIANPLTYKEYCNAGIDYVRVGIGGGSGCFHPNTEIITKDGIKRICDMKVGDEVLTHKGEYKSVKSIIKPFENSKLLKINNNVTCTENHKFYVINKEDKDKVNDDNISEYAYWVEADKLNKDKHLLITE